MDKEASIRQQVEEGISLRRDLVGQSAVLLAIADEIVRAIGNGNKVMLFGNGGSAADAQHIAGELTGRLRLDRDPLPAIALSADSTALTCVGNDYGFESVFARPLKALVKKGDVVIGISTSGMSRNVLTAMEVAQRHGAVTVALTGGTGELRNLVQHAVSVQSADPARIQETYLAAAHIICSLVEQELFGEE